jgi:SulP family sulfate permease
MVEAHHTASLPALAVGLLTLATLLLVPRFTRRIPAPLIALPIAALATLALQRLLPDARIDTIASRFSSEAGGVLVPGIPRVPPLPMWPWDAKGAHGAELAVGLGTLRELLPSAFVIAMLGAIESLLSAVVADGMARTRHDPDAELIALGVGNVLVPFFGGIPATGALARTATNVRSGARSPIAAIVHALTVLAAVLLLAPAVGYLPMAGLAALLLLVAWNMSEARHFVHTIRVAPRSDVAVLVICYGLTVVVDMVAAVSVGVVLAALLFMRRMAAVMQVQLREGEHAALPRAAPPGVVVYDITGPLFFGAAQKAMNALGAIGRARVVILRLEEVPIIDATGLVALESAVDRIREQRCLTLIVGLQPQPALVLQKSRLNQHPDLIKQCPDTESALAEAEAYLAGMHGGLPRSSQSPVRG